MMLILKAVNIGTAYTRSPSTSVMSAVQPRRYETAARTVRSSSAQQRGKARGHSRVYEQRPLTQPDGRQAPRQQHRVQAEDDGVVLLCRD
jgi:hypothetical protein